MGKALAFFYEDTSFKLTSRKKIRKWIEQVIHEEGYALNHINYIFCSDAYLLDINTTHLQHDFYTDIVTFDQSSDDKEIEADIYISVDRVADNANDRHIPFDKELARVMIHGVLHLLGYNDKTEEEKKQMREKEDSCISLHE
jgi:rRNA maturation RNase YbeY